LPGCGVGEGKLGQLQRHRAPSYKEILLCQSSSDSQEGMCLSFEGNVTAHKSEVSKEC
jgi:hypothetical protein